MNIIFKSTLLFFVIVGLLSCQKDDSTTTTPSIPYWQLAPIDDAKIIDFLSTNYFNEEDFATQPFTSEIEFSIDSLGGTRTLLFDYVNNVINNFTIETKLIYVEGVAHTLYILKIAQGLGVEQPKFCDEALLSYEGMTLQKDIFDNALNPVKLDLASTVKGFSESVSEFNIAAGIPTDNGDGTFTYHDYGVGVVFMPSGLGYYSGSAGSISAYTPLIFKLKVYGTTELDHDGDGVPTYVEDLNGDHYLNNDDTDLDGIPNYGDTNDDNDPVLTRNEVINTYVINVGDSDPIIISGEVEIDRVVNTNVVPNTITITRRIYKDTDLDGIPDYLDADS